jgi:hypothetical protein
MFGDLYEYLILYKRLNVPGIGTFLLERKPAVTDLTHRQINPPAYTISFQSNNEIPAKKFFYWLADRLQIHYHEAIVRFNSFVYDLKDQVASGNIIVWYNVGTITRGMSGDLRFEPAISEDYLDQPVSAARIIREKAVHNIRVGEEEKTSVEMIERLHPGEKQLTYWWAPALIVVIILLILLGLYFSQQGSNASPVGNQQKLSPQKASSTYKVLQ